MGVVTVGVDRRPAILNTGPCNRQCVARGWGGAAIGPAASAASPARAAALPCAGAMRSFFPMRGDEAATLAVLIAFSALAFLPALREVEVAGVALFGWAMAALMVLSPALALWIVVRGRARRRRGDVD